MMNWFVETMRKRVCPSNIILTFLDHSTILQFPSSLLERNSIQNEIKHARSSLPYRLLALKTFPVTFTLSYPEDTQNLRKRCVALIMVMVTC